MLSTIVQVAIKLICMLSDLKAAHKIGAKPILVRTGYGLETEQQLNKFTYRDIKKKTIVFDDLSSFADWVEQQ
mgnify:CR=1 FL=1